MPGREHGFFHAWRALAPYDRRLRRLAGPTGMRWLAQLPDRPIEALAASLDALGVDADRHVEALREHLGGFRAGPGTPAATGSEKLLAPSVETATWGRRG